MASWIAGLLVGATDFAVLYAPFVNSYRRLNAVFTKPVAAGVECRKCPVRLLGVGPYGQRFEYRLPGADTNPYLAISAILASGCYGVERKLSLVSGEPHHWTARGATDLPKNLISAAHEFYHSKTAQHAFGREIVLHYSSWARREYFAHQREVCSTDFSRYAAV
jgi:glutamine synthetase